MEPLQLFFVRIPLLILRVLNSDLSPANKKMIIEQMEYERDIRLMYVNTLTEQI